MTTSLLITESDIEEAIRDYLLTYVGNAAKFTGTVADGVLTVHELISGAIEIGQRLMGEGVLDNVLITGSVIHHPSEYLISDQTLSILSPLSLLTAGMEVVAAHDNRVSMPVDEFMLVEFLNQSRLSTNRTAYDLTGIGETTTQPVKACVQVDCLGPDAGSWALILSTLFRSEIAGEFFRANYPDISPLYEDDPRHIPLIDGEDQYTKRWVNTLYLQVNTGIVSPQDYATELTSGVISVDAQFPPR